MANLVTVAPYGVRYAYTVHRIVHKSGPLLRFGHITSSNFGRFSMKKLTETLNCSGVTTGSKRKQPGAPAVRGAPLAPASKTQFVKQYHSSEVFILIRELSKFIITK